MQAILRVIGKDRIGIVYDVSKLLAEERVNIVNISQQLMSGYFTMMIEADLSACQREITELAQVFADYGRACELDIRLQHEALFTAMHRI